MREVQIKDLDSLLQLSRSFSLYNLSNNKLLLKKKIEISQKSFLKKISAFKRNYCFILEDLKLKKIIGSSQILSFSGQQYSHCYLWKKDSSFLELTQVKTKRHQLGGLILEKAYRASPESLGFQIGVGRFLYVKLHAKDFFDFFEASLTSPFQEKNQPFWLETGAKYLKQDYPQALRTYRDNYSFFIKHLPENLKVSISSLSPPAQSCLSLVHPKTLPAYKGLLKKNFYPRRRHHLLDGAIYLENKGFTFLRKIKKYRLKFENKIQGFYFLMGQKTKKGFICSKVQAQKQGQFLKITKTPFFTEGEEIVALSMS